MRVLFDRDTLGEVARLIDVGTLGQSRVVSNQLYWQRVEDRRHDRIDSGQYEARCGLRPEPICARLVGQQHELATPRPYLLEIGRHLVEYRSGWLHHHGHQRVDQRDWPMLHFSPGVTLGMDVRDLLEL